jgi:hypothetical protein
MPREGEKATGSLKKKTIRSSPLLPSVSWPKAPHENRRRAVDELHRAVRADRLVRDRRPRLGADEVRARGRRVAHLHVLDVGLAEAGAEPDLDLVRGISQIVDLLGEELGPGDRRLPHDLQREVGRIDRGSVLDRLAEHDPEPVDLAVGRAAERRRLDDVEARPGGR